MKKIEENDFIIMRPNDTPVRFTDGTIVIYGSYDDALEDVCDGDAVMRAAFAPDGIRKEITEQINA